MVRGSLMRKYPLNVRVNKFVTARMLTILNRELYQDRSLSSALRALLRGGFNSIQRAVCLKSKLKISHPGSLNPRKDRIGFECFVNHIHLADECRAPSELPKASSRRMQLFGEAVQYSKHVLRRLKEDYPRRNFTFIISVPSQDCIVRFHTQKDKESWLMQDLDKYSEPVIEIKSRKISHE